MRWILTVAIVFALPLLAQREHPSIGLWGGLGANLHAPDFSVNTVKYDRTATGLGWNIGAGVSFPVASWVGLGVRAGYTRLDAELEGSAIDSLLQARLATVELFPHALLWMGRLYFPIGLEVGIPATAAYERTGQAARDIPQSTTRLALSPGVGYAFPLSSSVVLTPELSLRVPLSDVSGEWKPWKVTQPRLSLGLQFLLARAPEAPKPTPAAPVVSVTPGRLDEAGNFSAISRLRVEEVKLTEYFPLLPYVFFREQSKEMLGEYRLQAKGTFATDRLTMDALEVNRAVLDIVGERMQKYPTARLTLTGTTDGKQEARDAELPRRRAEAVREYLVNAWGISPERISVNARRMPEKPSTSTSPIPEDRRDGDAENRRVELSATMPEILAPLPLEAQRQRLLTPEVIAWKADITAQSPVTSWELLLTQAGDTLEILRGSGAPSVQLWRVRPEALRAGEFPIEYLLRVTDANGRSAQTVGSLPVEYVSILRKRSEQLPDRTVTRFSLVLFDFDSDALTPENERVLQTLVLPAVTANSTVRIAGYTDRIGETNYNQDLSLRRARRVRDWLAARIPTARYEIAGYGESVLLFDNNSPIGRQLCRTVQITIETPISAP